MHCSVLSLAPQRGTKYIRRGGHHHHLLPVGSSGGLKLLNMATQKVIIFGPTGQIGSSAARTARELGAKVILAMRDTGKPIPGLSSEQEKNGAFERVQADLTQPDTVLDAVKQTQAKHAFLYIALGSPDHLKSTIQALKSGGIELVVFVSSFTVRGELEDVKQSDVIPYIHAQVEINLRDIFGADGYVAARPGSFASNSRQWKAGIEKGEVEIYMPEAMVDGIVPEDIGRVCGKVLAKGPQDESRALYLYGPRLMSQEQQVKTIAGVLGKEVKIKSLGREEAYKMLTEQRGMPPPLAEYMTRQAPEPTPGVSRVFGFAVGEEELSNVEEYSGKPATTFEAWAQQNKQMFVS